MSYGDFHRWLYKGGKPNWIARIVNRGWAIIHATGIVSNYWVTLEVAGRRTGKLISFPLAMAVVDGERYLVSMLGAESSWVKNVHAAGGKAKLIHGKTEFVHLDEIPVEQRPKVLKAYLRVAPAARQHLPVDKDAPLEAFAAIADQFPTFRISTISE